MERMTVKYVIDDKDYVTLPAYEMLEDKYKQLEEENKKLKEELSKYEKQYQHSMGFSDFGGYDLDQ